MKVNFHLQYGNKRLLLSRDNVLTIKDIQTGMARAHRNRLLADSDPMTISDRGLSDSKVTEWKTYRKSLRDLDFSDVESNHIDDITWPTKPA